jgi:hypothetical protein
MCYALYTTSKLSNHVCLLGLGLAVLVRTVVIGQRAYDMLLPSTSGDDQAVAVAAVASHTAETPGTINAPAIAPVVVNTPSSEDQSQAALQQNLTIPRSSAPKSKRRRQHKRAGVIEYIYTAIMAADFSPIGARWFGSFLRGLEQVRPKQGTATSLDRGLLLSDGNSGSNRRGISPLCGVVKMSADASAYRRTRSWSSTLLRRDSSA